jgi:hypothetical protein
MAEIDNKLTTCLSLVAEKSGLGDWKKWTKRDYEQLSILIEKKTRIILSVSTLVRLFKASSGHKPQKGTLDALAQFIGFDTWHSFCTCNDLAYLSKPAVPVARRRIPTRNAVYIIGLGVLLILGFFGSRALFFNRSIDPDDVKFKIRNSEITGVPATIQVEYELGKHKPDSLWLQLYWNPDEKYMISPDQNRTSSIYYYPGVHLCKLLADGEIIGEQRVYIKTSGWTALIRNSGLQLIPLYIKNSEIIHDGVLQVTESMINIQNIQPTSQMLTSYYFVNDLGPISSDDYTISGSIRNPATTLGTQPCLFCTVYILGEFGKHFFTIGDLGCSAYFNLGFSGSNTMETYPDLTDFEYLSGGWDSFTTFVKGNSVVIYVNKSKVYSSNQVANVGKIKGIHFYFSGLGAIDQVKLVNSVGYVAIDEDFE